jgi:protein-S-isoprenylcysteine O-methyltransferase Ste14
VDRAGGHADRADGGLVVRIRVEERALETDLGQAYRSYAATRKRLIPYIW